MLQKKIAKAINNEPWFVGKDVAQVLGYVNPRDAVNRHCKGALKRCTPTTSGVQEMSFIPESDLYRLVFRSKLPGAEKFTDWVMEEVLPSIRKHVQAEDKGVVEMTTPGGVQQITAINESGRYSLILSSKLPSVK